jgi:outer membrane protein assembly factor BamA
MYVGGKNDGASNMHINSTGQIHIVGKVDNSRTLVLWWGAGIQIDGGVHGDAYVEQANWFGC